MMPSHSGQSQMPVSPNRGKMKHLLLLSNFIGSSYPKKNILNTLVINKVLELLNRKQPNNCLQ